MSLENLIVAYAEDEDAISLNVSSVLSLYVKQVYVAKNGEELLKIYHKIKPDILLIDICMPHLDGLEALKIIRENDKKTPAIIMSAHTQKEYLLKAVELYITKYLIKPFNKTKLLEALNQCLNLLSKTSNILHVNEDIRYDFSLKELVFENEHVKLSKKESLLLELLLNKKGYIVTPDEIEYHVYNSFDVSDEAKRALLKDLRKKLKCDIIQTRRGLGYIIEKN